MSWTEDRVERLKKMWLEGMSASQIAGELGGVTRNAVIGKVHRLGMSGRGKPTSTASSRPRKTSSSGSSRRTTSSTPRTVGATALKAEAAPLQDARPEPKPMKLEVYEGAKKLSIMELTENTCKWPIGDPATDDFYFCGCKAEEGSPYCTYHAKIAYQSSRDRRSERRAMSA
jgi:GcrA cell cycle regulator